MMMDSVIINKARWRDYLFLYRLVNEPGVKKYARQRMPWDFYQHLEDFSSEKYIIRVKEIKIGAIREHGGEISIALLEDYWGKGYGSAALLEVMRLYDSLYALINKDNARSIKLFKRCGFKYSWVSREEGLHHYTWRRDE